MSSDIYREIILDHYKNPRNYGVIDNADIKSKDHNPLCGDVLELYIKFSKDKKVIDVKFSGKGCAISQASASIITEMIHGKHIDDIKLIDKDKLLTELGTPDLGHTRIKCALLSLKVLKTGYYSYVGESYQEEE